MTKTSSHKKILVLGAHGLIGEALFDNLRAENVDVTGAVLENSKKNNQLLTLDITDKNAVNTFPWKDFDVVVNCAGNIDYKNTIVSAQQNLLVNTYAPLSIIENLQEKHRYYHCSTHAVLLSSDEQNTYSFSKLFFEYLISKVEQKIPKITLFRIPAVFGEKRISGLLHAIKTHFLSREKLVLNSPDAYWHCMYAQRVVSIMTAIIKGSGEDALVTIGYPEETTTKHIVSVAQKSFGYEIPIEVTGSKTNHYFPDIRVQEKYIQLGKDSLANDLNTYFKNL